MTGCGCAVCGSTTGRPVAEENGFTLIQCACGGMFLDREPPPGYIDPAYDPHHEEFYTLPAKVRLGFLTAHAPTGLLLEIGCGRGAFLSAAQHAGYAVAGIEVDPDRARAASNALGVEIECALLEHSSRPDASCDAVYHCDLLSHFPDPTEALRRMRRMLRDGGTMAFEVGLVGGGPPSWYRTGSLRLPHHRWFFDERAVRRLVGTAGFKVIALQRFGLGPGFALARLAAALRLGGGSTRPKVFSPELGRHMERRGNALAPEEHKTNRSAALRAHAYAFARYRIGALTPHFGPGTAFVAAVPA